MENIPQNNNLNSEVLHVVFYPPGNVVLF